MVQVNVRLIALLAAVMALALPLIRRYDPMRPASRAVGLAVTGVIVLSVWNFLMPSYRLGVNPLSAAAAGWLGAPGIALLTP